MQHQDAAPAGPAVTVARDGPIEVVTIDNPPVNALSAAVRSGLLSAVEWAAADPTVKGIVIACAGRTFIAGADIREFGRPALPPPLFALVARIEACGKPVVAAMHGKALGGGLELALGCHARIAAESTTMGLPEVTLGLLPGAGGTQRLPRLIGIESALQMIVEGQPVTAGDALAMGLIDAVAAEPVAAACRLATQLAAEGRWRVTRGMDVPGRDAGHEALFAAESARLAGQSRGFPAPLKALDAVKAAVALPFEAGMAVEHAAFDALLRSPESKALRHVFFAERAYVNPKPTPGAPPRSVASAAVIGAGAMGQGIALCLAEADLPVTLIDADAAALARAKTQIERFYDGRVARGRIAPGVADARRAGLCYAPQLAAAAGADLIVEAVFEDLAVKREVFAQLDAVAKHGAILASNTSYLDLDQIAAATRRPQDVLGLHFFNPAHIMKLLEVVRGAATAEDVLATGLALGARLGKIGVPMRNGYGFTGNRMLAARTREAYFLLEEGATPQQVDRVFEGFGFPMGPFAMADLAGLDVGWRNRRARLERLTPREQACDVLDQVCALQRFGQKSGRGFYLYDADRRRSPDPEIEELIRRHSVRLGLVRREIGDREILNRCLYAMVNEAARLLEEEIVAQPCDVDMVWLHGYGFPRYRGGPLYWADTVGAADIVDGIERFAREHGSAYWSVAPGLARMSRAGRGFYSPA